MIWLKHCFFSLCSNLSLTQSKDLKTNVNNAYLFYYITVCNISWR
jgi:hypothetical protein